MTDDPDDPDGRLAAIRLAMEAIGHFRRIEVLIACADKATSPGDISDRRTLGKTAYHFRYLRERGYLRQTRQQQVRGALATYYTATPKARSLLNALGISPTPRDRNAGASA